MYEHRKQKLAPIEVFYKRVLKNILLAASVLFVCLMIGVLGYHFTANIPWLDSLHNASMILSGMGPVVGITTVGGKWFSSFFMPYSAALYL